MYSSSCVADAVAVAVTSQVKLVLLLLLILIRVFAYSKLLVALLVAAKAWVCRPNQHASCPPNHLLVLFRLQYTPALHTQLSSHNTSLSTVLCISTSSIACIFHTRAPAFDCPFSRHICLVAIFPDALLGPLSRLHRLRLRTLHLVTPYSPTYSSTCSSTDLLGVLLRQKIGPLNCYRHVRIDSLFTGPNTPGASFRFD